MSLTYSHECEAVDIIDCILDGITQDLEHEVRVYQDTASKSFALVSDTGCLFIGDYEANSYGFDNNTNSIQEVLDRCGIPLKFIW
jgi:hypothetical protein